MKNLRTAAAASIALTAALALSACTPPHQNDSDQPFKDNQSGQSTPSLDIQSTETSQATGSAVSSSETAATEGTEIDPGFTNEGTGTQSGAAGQEETQTDTSAQ